MQARVVVTICAAMCVLSYAYGGSVDGHPEFDSTHAHINGRAAGGEVWLTFSPGSHYGNLISEVRVKTSSGETSAQVAEKLRAKLRALPNTGSQSFGADNDIQIYQAEPGDVAVHSSDSGILEVPAIQKPSSEITGDKGIKVKWEKPTGANYDRILIIDQFGTRRELSGDGTFFVEKPEFINGVIRLISKTVVYRIVAYKKGTPSSATSISISLPKE